MHIEHIDLSKDIPEKFTKEMYINTFNKIWATIRHDMWKEIQAFKKKERIEKLTEEQFSKIYNDVHQRFEDVRCDIYSLMMDEEIDNKEHPREVM